MSDSPAAPAVVAKEIVDVSGSAPAKAVDVSGATAVISEEAKFVIDLLCGNPPANRKDAEEVYHQITIMFGTWVVSNLPAVEQKAVLGALWVEKKKEEVAELKLPS